MQEIAGNLGVSNLVAMLKDKEKCVQGLFPKTSIDDARFAVNFYTSIGLGAVTEDLRSYLDEAPKLALEARYQELLKQAQELNENLSSSDSDDSEESKS